MMEDLSSSYSSSESDSIVKVLRNSRKQSIKSLNFEEAEMISDEIQQRKLERKQISEQAYIEWYKAKIRAIVQHSNKVLEDLSAKKVQEEHKIRMRINGLFDTMKKTHLQQLSKLESQTSSMKLRETGRTVSESQILLTKAMNLATSGNFSDASNALIQSRSAQFEDLQGRMEKTEKGYQSSISSLIMQQRVDLDSLSKKLDDELQQNELKYKQMAAKAVDLMNRRLSATTTKCSSVASSAGMSENLGEIAIREVEDLGCVAPELIAPRRSVKI